MTNENRKTSAAEVARRTTEGEQNNPVEAAALDLITSLAGFHANDRLPYWEDSCGNEITDEKLAEAGGVFAAAGYGYGQPVALFGDLLVVRALDQKWSGEAMADVWTLARFQFLFGADRSLPTPEDGETLFRPMAPIGGGSGDLACSRCGVYAGEPDNATIVRLGNGEDVCGECQPCDHATISAGRPYPMLHLTAYTTPNGTVRCRLCRAVIDPQPEAPYVGSHSPEGDGLNIPAREGKVCARCGLLMDAEGRCTAQPILHFAIVFASGTAMAQCMEQKSVRATTFMERVTCVTCVEYAALQEQPGAASRLQDLQNAETIRRRVELHGTPPTDIERAELARIHRDERLGPLIAGGSSETTTPVRDGYTVEPAGARDMSGNPARKVHAPDGRGIGEIVGRPGAWRALFYGVGHLLTLKAAPDAIETIIYRHERAGRQAQQARVASASAGGAFRSPQLVEDGPPVHVADLAAVAASRGAPLTLDVHTAASIRNRAQAAQAETVVKRLSAARGLHAVGPCDECGEVETLSRYDAGTPAAIALCAECDDERVSVLCANCDQPLEGNNAAGAPSCCASSNAEGSLKGALIAGGSRQPDGPGGPQDHVFLADAAGTPYGDPGDRAGRCPRCGLWMLIPSMRRAGERLDELCDCSPVIAGVSVREGEQRMDEAAVADELTIREIESPAGPGPVAR